MWQFQCTLKNGRTRKCFRANVFKLVEDKLAFSRKNTKDGITVRGKDVVVQLVFQERVWMLQFESAILCQCASTTADKKPKYEAVEVVAKPSGDNEEEEEPNLFEVCIADLTWFEFASSASDADLVRIFRYSYVHETDEQSSYNSLPCNTVSDAHSMSLYDDPETVTIVEAETRVQMLEDHTHRFFHGKNAEVAHIKDKASCDSAEAKDINNRLHMSRHLHEAFDGINTVPKKFPWFLVRYVSHDEVKVDCPKIGNDAVVAFPFRKRNRTIVHVEFNNECSENDYVELLRNNMDKVDHKTYELELYFEDAVKAKKYLDWKVEKTLARWNEEKNLS
jgi:hypothetical protein